MAIIIGDATDGVRTGLAGRLANRIVAAFGGARYQQGSANAKLVNTISAGIVDALNLEGGRHDAGIRRWWAGPELRAIFSFRATPRLLDPSSHHRCKLHRGWDTPPSVYWRRYEEYCRCWWPMVYASPHPGLDPAIRFEIQPIHRFFNCARQQPENRDPAAHGAGHADDQRFRAQERYYEPVLEPGLHSDNRWHERGHRNVLGHRAGLASRWQLALRERRWRDRFLVGHRYCGGQRARLRVHFRLLGWRNECGVHHHRLRDRRVLLVQQIDQFAPCRARARPRGPELRHEHRRISGARLRVRLHGAELGGQSSLYGEHHPHRRYPSCLGGPEQLRPGCSERSVGNVLRLLQLRGDGAELGQIVPVPASDPQRGRIRQLRGGHHRWGGAEVHTAHPAGRDDDLDAVRD